MRREEIEKRLGCGKVEGLSKEFQEMGHEMAARYVKIFTIPESCYILSEEITFNRIANKMAAALKDNPDLTPKQFKEKLRLEEIFYDAEAINELIGLVSEDLDGEYFVYACHFFSLKVISFIKHHKFYLRYMNKDEAAAVLYPQVFMALKSCNTKGTHISFSKLAIRFNAAMRKLAGEQGMPFHLSAKESELYFRFRAEVTLNPEKKYSFKDAGFLSEFLSIPVEKVVGYFKLLEYETAGFFSLSSALTDEDYSGILLEHVADSYSEEAFESIDKAAEVRDFRDANYKDEAERRIFDRMIQNGDDVMTQADRDALGVTKYQVKKVKSKFSAIE